MGETGGSHSKFPHFFITIYENYGGETGIRTLGGLAPTTVFETAPFDHSGTSPQALSLVIPNPADKPIF